MYFKGPTPSAHALHLCSFMYWFRMSFTLFYLSWGERGRGSMVGKLCVFFIWGYWHLPISSWSTDFITHCCRYLLFMMVTATTTSHIAVFTHFSLTLVPCWDCSWLSLRGTRLMADSCHTPNIQSTAVFYNWLTSDCHCIIIRVFIKQNNKTWDLIFMFSVNCMH